MVHLAARLRTGMRTLAGWCSRSRRGDSLGNGQARPGTVTVMGDPYPGQSPALAELAHRNVAAAVADAGLRHSFPATQANPWRNVRNADGGVVLFPAAPQPH